MIIQRIIRVAGLTSLVLGVLALSGMGQELKLTPRRTQSSVVEWKMRLRVMEGVKEGTPAAPAVVTSSFLNFMFSANFRSDEDLAEEQGQIKRIFNLQDVQLLTEGLLEWPLGQPDKVDYVFRLDGKEFQVKVRCVDFSTKPGQMSTAPSFGIEVLEKMTVKVEGAAVEKQVSLLDTQFTVPTSKDVAVFGFEDIQGKPYFVSLRHVRLVGIGVWISEPMVDNGKPKPAISLTTPQFDLAKYKEGKPPGTEGAVGGVKDQTPGGLDREAVGIKDGFQPPKLVKSVDPVYPEIARLLEVEGVVILEATIDEAGNVAAVKILRSIPLLEQAACDAVGQWKYEPLIIDGKAHKAIFTVTVHFMLRTGNKEKDLEKFALGAVKAEGTVKPPKLIKVVDPIYPVEARKAGVEGAVILAVKTDAAGYVQDIMILRSIPRLNQAAIDAVKQWVYEPLILNGMPTPVVFTVTARFLNPDKGNVKK